MPTTFRTPVTNNQESFFSTAVAKWVSLIALAFCAALLYVTFNQAPTLEDVLKVSLLTVPASLYMVYRSFVAHI